MEYKATRNALEKINTYKLTEKEINEINESVKQAKVKEGKITDVLINWKNKDIVVFPMAEKEIYLYVYGENEIPNINIKYENKKWIKK